MLALRSRLLGSALPARGALTLGRSVCGALVRPSALPSQLCCQALRHRSTIPLPHDAAAVLGNATSSIAAAVTAPIVHDVPRAVGWWLIGTSVSVFAMVVVGGITRLTRSGLSMTDWRPTGKRWPRSELEWEAEFEQYKQFPEYQRLYAGKGSTFGLADFKNIFFWEWAHRMFGRTIGLIYGLPLAYFALRGQIPRSLAPTLGGLLLLGGSQGLVGWWMVKSGLDSKLVDEIDGGIPRVSPYRLATHLTCAFTIFSVLLYTGLGVLQPRCPTASTAALLPLQLRVRLLAALVGVTAISGAFVAGMQAGYSFNTFPLMEGRLIPEGYMELQPLYRNFFESTPSVQLHHRGLALTTLSSVTALWLYLQPMPLPPQLRLATDALLLAAWAQVSLGVATLVNCVPVHLGSAHQAGALTLFSVVLFTLHSCRVPHAGATAARIVRSTAARNPALASKG
tara:strand:+ start:99 stop:1457 length:1359 start_codon:yes stop_codon:yes gene_type:complete